MCAISTVNNVFSGPSCNNVDSACYFGIVVRLKIPNLKWEQPFDVASMYGKQKAFWCAMIRWVTVPFTSPGCPGNPLLCTCRPTEKQNCFIACCLYSPSIQLPPAFSSAAPRQESASIQKQYCPQLVPILILNPNAQTAAPSPHL